MNASRRAEPPRFRRAAAILLRFRETLCAKGLGHPKNQNHPSLTFPPHTPTVDHSGQGDYYSGVPPPEEEGSLWSWLTGEDDEPRRGESANFNNEDEDTFTVRFLYHIYVWAIRLTAYVLFGFVYSGWPTAPTFTRARRAGRSSP